MPVPNAVAALPGMDRVTTRLMERRIEDNDTTSAKELLETNLEMGVEFQACQMTIDLLDYDEDDFYDGVTVGVGAATALEDTADSDIQFPVRRPTNEFDGPSDSSRSVVRSGSSASTATRPDPGAPEPGSRSSGPSKQASADDGLGRAGRCPDPIRLYRERDVSTPSRR